MFLLFDTETTNFPSPKVSSSHPSQAHICQLAILQLSEDLIELNSFVCLIHPEDKWKVSEGARAVHGITTEDCSMHGVPITHALDTFAKSYEANRVIVGHNLQFDLKMLSIDIEASGIQFKMNGDKYPICTMEKMTPIMKLPHIRRNSFGTQYKWPKLEEAYSFVTRGQRLEGPHDALIDIRATATVLRYLVENKLVQIPSSIDGIENANVPIATR